MNDIKSINDGSYVDEIAVVKLENKTAKPPLYLNPYVINLNTPLLNNLKLVNSYSE
jgi:hypothetical protein